MNCRFSCLSLLLILIFYFQSTTTTAYPSSYAQRQRGYLLCQLSAVSCKRSLTNSDNVENPSEINFDDYLQMCLALNKPLRHCLDQALYETSNTIK